MLTGLNPPRHGVHDNGVDALGPEPSLLSESLRDAGYATAAFVGAFVLDERFGLDRGFDVYDFEVHRDGYRPQMADFNERSAKDVTDAALAWLRDRPVDQPFFAWLHFFDPHLPYTSPLQQRPEFRDRPYAAEIAYADQQLGRVVAWLEASDRADRTLVIVVSDHGEALGEHHEETHGMFIYEPTMRVAMVIWSPALFQGPLRLADRVAGLVDLRATIEDLVGVAGAGSAGDGLSLLGEIPADRQLYLETEGPLRMAHCSPLRGLRSTGEKFIEAPDREFYDLVADPGESKNLYTERGATLGPYEAALANWTTGAVADAAERQLSDDEITRLESLGYTVNSRSGDHGSLPDPKRMIHQFNDGMRAEQLYGQGDYEGAARLARRILARCDGCLNAVRVLAFSQLRLGHADSAVALLGERAAATSDTYLLRSLAKAQIMSGDVPGALRTLEAYAALAPGDGRVEVLRGDCQAALGDPEAALRHYERAMEIDPHRSGIRAQDRMDRTREQIGGP
jgi:arylsulfatase A-like enzyme